MLIMMAMAMATEAPGNQGPAQETVVYANVAGGLGFLLLNIGDFAVGAEHRFGAHGVVIEGTLIHMHGAPTHATTYGGQAGYRYHVGGAFVGLMVGYERGFAKYYTAEHGGPFLGYDLEHVSVMPHVGYRWELGEHVAVTARFGGGYGGWTITPRETGNEAAAELLADRLQFTPIKLDSELSIGVRF